MSSPIAFVLHANQFVITDGYADRDGISVTAAGYDSVLSLHVELQIPVSLHISGPVLESLAWHRPALLSRLREHLASGWVTPIGGTYGENIMPLASPRHNRRQLRMTSTISKAQAGAERVEEVLRSTELVQESPEATPAGPLRGEIEFVDVSFGYQPGQSVLSHVSLSMPAGHTIALAGRRARENPRSPASSHGSTTSPTVACYWTATTSGISR